MKSFLGEDLYLIEQLKLLLEKNNKTIATAESCTGGLLATILTDLSGSSQFYQGGVCCYSNASKIDLLQVSSQIIQECGAVSEEVANMMAIRVSQLFSADFGISVTGVAGPLGGTDRTSVGNVWCGFYYNGHCETRLMMIAGDRYTVRLTTVKCVLQRVIQILERS